MMLVGGNSIAILLGAKQKSRSRDTFYHFRQDSDFYYLTGYLEPNAVMVLIPDRKHGEYILFCDELEVETQDSDNYKHLRESLWCDDVFPASDLEDILPDLMEGRDRIHYDFGIDFEFDDEILSWNNSENELNKKRFYPPSDFISLSYFVHEMRKIKSPAEITMVTRACEISAFAHIQAMKVCSPTVSELRIESEIKYQFGIRGARHKAYHTIVAGGERACICHYTDNTSTLDEGELVLIDAGAELHGYASDISRTLPVNGTFSVPQKEAYEWVLKANIAAINAVRPGNLWTEPHEVAVQVLTEGLVSMGILQGKVSKLVQQEAYRPYFPYKVGHWLGLDVHDVGDYEYSDEPVCLEEGMVLTIEPGLYFTDDIDGLDEKWHGMGIRIEDVVVVTADGNKVLSSRAPKEVDDIERIVQSC
jgi:Xaa-Pro aminopeptidase